MDYWSESLVLNMETYTLPPSGTRTANLSTPQLAGYRVEELLGRGGMGSVYAARDLRNRRDVALKVTLGASVAEQERLRLEADVQRQLRHAGIPRVFAAGVLSDGRAYLCQEQVPEARTLEEAAQGASVGQLLAWTSAAAAALADAHGRCVTHGDVKPENLLVSGTGQLFLVDWGVAVVARCGAPEPARLSAPLEEVAQRLAQWVQGTLPYMPPEQLHGPATPKADVYSLGLVLYELLAGRHPLRDTILDGTSDDMIQAIQNQPLPPRLRSVSPSLARLIERCLSKTPAQRPRAAELAQSLALEERALLRVA